MPAQHDKRNTWQENEKDPARARARSYKAEFCHFVLFGNCSPLILFHKQPPPPPPPQVFAFDDLILHIEHQQMLSKQLTAAAIATIFGSLASNVHGHGHLVSPRSRQFVAFQDGVDSGGGSTTPLKEYCPHCKLGMLLLLFLSCFYRYIPDHLALAHIHIIPSLPLLPHRLR